VVSSSPIFSTLALPRDFLKGRDQEGIFTIAVYLLYFDQTNAALVSIRDHVG